MKWTIAVFTAACLASTALAPTPASAGNNGAAFIGGVITGVVGGAILNNIFHQHHPSRSPRQPRTATPRWHPPHGPEVIVTRIERHRNPPGVRGGQAEETTDASQQLQLPDRNNNQASAGAQPVASSILPVRPVPSPPINVVPLPEPPKPLPTPSADTVATNASPLDTAIESFLIRVRSNGASPQLVDRAVALKALDTIYASAPVSRLEALPNEGWTREVLQTRILRRAENMLPEFYADLVAGTEPRDMTLGRLFDRAAAAALPNALLEQEAVAFSASVKRFADQAGRLTQQQPTPQESAMVVPVRGLGPAPTSTPPATLLVERTLQDMPSLLAEVDREVDRRGLGLRGKLRARRIMLDCVAEQATLGVMPIASLPATTPQLASIASPSDGSATCAQRVRDQFGPSDRLNPAPAESVWTQQGPMLRGQRWILALDQG